MAVIRIPAALRSYVNGQAEVTVHGETVGAAFEDLLVQFPSMRPQMINSEGLVRQSFSWREQRQGFAGTEYADRCGRKNLARTFCCRWLICSPNSPAKKSCVTPATCSSPMWD
jgi:hypothetical protein